MPATRLRTSDTSMVATRLTSSRFVGRQSQLAELELCFRAATDGSPSLVLIGGDSGIGKTRLLDEASCRFAEALVLRGESLEQGELELPYAPLLGALRPLVREKHPAFADLSRSGASNLARLLPSLAGPEDDPQVDSADGQVRLFEGLLEMLHVLSQRQPVVLLLEDIHWADGSTRAFIAFLARNLTEERLLTIATYRTDELHRRHALRPLLADLTRLERTRRLTLDPFDRAELAEILTDLRGSTPEQPLLERLLTRTDGNPLYVEELLATDLSGSGPAPESLRDVFLLRSERLTPQARQAAQVLSVGVTLDEGVISQVSQLDENTVSEGLRQALGEQLVVVGSDGGFRFRHALLREAIYEDLLPGERSNIHSRLAQALESAAPPRCAEDEAERVATIAAHFTAAGDQRSALRATISAGRAALRVHAYTEAAELSERALDLWRYVPDAEQLTGTDRTGLMQTAAEATSRAGDQRRSEMLANEALKQLDAEAEPSRYSQLLVVRGRARWRLNQAPQAREDAQQALALLSEEPTAARAELLSWIARTEMLRGRYQDAITMAQAARELAQQLELQVIVAEALNTLGSSYGLLGDLDSGERLLREAIAVALDHDSSGNQTSVDLSPHYANLAERLHATGQSAAALEVVDEGLEATEGGSNRSSNLLLICRSVIAFESGDWAGARATPLPPTSSLQGVSLMSRLLRDAQLALGEGDNARARECLTEVRPLVRVTAEAQWHAEFGTLDAELHLREGDLEGAQKAITNALDELETCTDDVVGIADASGHGIWVEADRATRARALHDPAMEQDALARAEIHFGRLRAATEDGGPIQQAGLKTGTAEFARARGENDPLLWREAAAAWAELGRPYVVALVQSREAEAFVEAGQRDEAAKTVTQALQTAERLGAGWLVDELRSLTARARLNTSEPEADVAVAAEVQAENPFELTARELQVLVLLSDGATNRQIGEALFMAEKTASVHVSRILSKLDVRSRTQAAAVAHRLHLT
jgi:DNA-binding NarL/FixJ family response regulator/tetratricopeptide (TPR) repeat protein